MSEGAKLFYTTGLLSTSGADRDTFLSESHHFLSQKRSSDVTFMLITRRVHITRDISCESSSGQLSSVSNLSSTWEKPLTKILVQQLLKLTRYGTASTLGELVLTPCDVEHSFHVSYSLLMNPYLIRVQYLSRCLLYLLIKSLLIVKNCFVIGF